MNKSHYKAENISLEIKPTLSKRVVDLSIIATGIAAIITFIVALIPLIANKTFGEMGGDLFPPLNTTSAATYYNRYTMTVCILLLVLCLVFLFIAYFKEATKTQQYIMISLLAFIAVAIAILIVVSLFGISSDLLLMGSSLTLFICFIWSFIMLSRTSMKRQVKLFWIVSLATFMVLPVLLIIIENILAILSVVVFLALAVGVFLFIGAAFFGGDSSEAGTALPASNASGGKPSPVEQARIIKVDSNQKLWRDIHGVNDAKVIMSETFFRGKFVLCDQHAIETGKVKIERGGKCVLLQDIP